MARIPRLQLQLLADFQVTDADARAGVGGVFSLTDPAKINHLQQIAVTQSRLHIPILFAFDTIHGYRTIFPIPLGAASSFDPSVATADDTIAARETATVGIKQIYSPMVDVSHEPRWGRIAEGAGEDPYLGAAFAAARVKAAQGRDYSAPDKVVTSPKHLAAYGQPEGGREYNTTDMSEQRLRNLYLPPFKAAVDAGADTVMCRQLPEARRPRRRARRGLQVDGPAQERRRHAAARPSKSVAVIAPLGDDQHDMLASCPSPSRGCSARCRSTTTTSPPAAPATSTPSSTRATATWPRATRCTPSASGSATPPSPSPTCG